VKKQVNDMVDVANEYKKELDELKVRIEDLETRLEAIINEANGCLERDLSVSTYADVNHIKGLAQNGLEGDSND